MVMVWWPWRRSRSPAWRLMRTCGSMSSRNTSPSTCCGAPGSVSSPRESCYVEAVRHRAQCRPGLDKTCGRSSMTNAMNTLGLREDLTAPTCVLLCPRLIGRPGCRPSPTASSGLNQPRSPSSRQGCSSVMYGIFELVSGPGSGGVDSWSFSKSSGCDPRPRHAAGTRSSEQAARPCRSRSLLRPPAVMTRAPRGCLLRHVRTVRETPGSTGLVATRRIINRVVAGRPVGLLLPAFPAVS